MKKRRPRKSEEDWHPQPLPRCDCGAPMGRDAERCQHCETYGTPAERDAWFTRWLAGDEPEEEDAEPAPARRPRGPPPRTAYDLHADR